MEMPGRKWQGTADDYRYGMNGKEKAGEINTGDYDFGARTYDSRIGRWMSTDPHSGAYPSISPYSGFYNNPNLFVDNDGRDNIIYIVNFSSGQPGLNIVNAAKTLQGCVDNIMGTDKVKVVVLSPKEFDKTKLDPGGSDVVIAYGDIVSVKNFITAKENYPNNSVFIEDFETHANKIENSDFINNISAVIDNRIAQAKNNTSEFFGNSNREAYFRPGNSAQDLLVLTLLHAVGHMTGNENNSGHTNTKGNAFGSLKGGLWLYNFMMDGDKLLETASRNNKQKEGFPFARLLNSFKDFYNAFWNPLVFKPTFSLDFSKEKSTDKMSKNGTQTGAKPKGGGGSKQKQTSWPHGGGRDVHHK